ncbi:MAG: lysylphosphatidylglycerol synthase transmembrane domain-containing protein [Vicinamibacterales bacterium]
MKVLTSTAARLIITAAILAYLLRSIDVGASVQAMLRVNPWWFAFTLLLVAIDRVVMAIRWLLLLRAAGVDLPAASTLRIFLTSSFVGSFLPAGVGADAARAYEVASRTSRGSQAVASVGVDRVLGLVAIAIVGIAGLAGWSRHVDPDLRLRLMAAAALAGAATLAVFWVDAVVRALLPARWRATRWGWRIQRLGDAIGAYRQHPRVLLQVMALSIAVQFVRVLQAYGLGRGLGLEIGLPYYLVFMPVAMLLLLLPVSISGFGLPQAAIVWLLRPMGVPDAGALALSTLIIVVGIIGNLPGALLYAIRKKPVT